MKKLNGVVVLFAAFVLMLGFTSCNSNAEEPGLSESPVYYTVTFDSDGGSQVESKKIESGKTTLDIKEVAIGLLLEEINSVISFQAKAKNQEYIVRIEEMEHDTFMGDKQRINEILMNILGNAIKYTPEMALIATSAALI